MADFQERHDFSKIPGRINRKARGNILMEVVEINNPGGVNSFAYGDDFWRYDHFLYAKKTKDGDFDLIDMSVLQLPYGPKDDCPIRVFGRAQTAEEAEKSLYEKAVIWAKACSEIGNLPFRDSTGRQGIGESPEVS